MSSDMIDYIDDITPSNKKYTRGVVLYELLKFADTDDQYEDDVIDHYESDLDNKLNNKINNIVYSINNVLTTDTIVVDMDGGKQVNIWLPVNIVDDLSHRYSNDIGEAIKYYKVRPFRDREHRVNVKRDILEYINNIKSKSEMDDVAVDIVNGEYDSNKVAEKIYTEDENEVWWKQMDTTTTEMMERAEEVPKTKSKRVEFAKEYILQMKLEIEKDLDEDDDKSRILNKELPTSYRAVENIIKDLWNPSAPTVKAYTDEVVKIYKD